MSGVELKVQGTDLEKLIEAATIQALGDVGRDALVKEVVRYLTTAGPRGNYSSEPTPSPLMQSLRNAAFNAASVHFRQKLQNDPAFVEQIDQLYADAVKKFFQSETREKAIDRMVERMAKAFEDRY